MPIMTDLTTGEEKEVSMEEFLQAMQGDDICIKQVVRNADGTEMSSVIYGNENQDSQGNTLNIFAEMDCVIGAAFLKIMQAKARGLEPTLHFQISNDHSGYEVIVDDMIHPLMYIFSFSEEEISVRSYIRDERKSIMGTPKINQRYPFIEGEISAEVSDIREDPILCYAIGVYEIINLLEERGLLSKLREMKNQGCGVWVTNSEKVETKIVKGLDRPELPCVLFGGMFAESFDDIIMMRPYVDEIFMNNSNDESEIWEEKETQVEVDLEERLYDFLMDQNEAKSIGEINSEQEFQEIPRRILVQALQSLVDEGIAFRSLRDGKAYYFKEKGGTGNTNPVKLQINNMQAMLNGVKPKVESCELIEEIEEEDSTVNVADLKITYKEKKEISCEQYKMRIPDGFEIIQEEGRDFVAYLRNPNMEDEEWSMGGSLITILPSVLSPSEFGNEYCNMDIHSMYYEYLFWNVMRGNMGILFGETEFMPIKTAHTAGGTIYTKILDTHHYYVNLYTGEGYKQIHYQIDNITGSKEEIYKIICEITEGFVLEKPLQSLRKLDDAYFMGTSVSNKKVKEWLELFDKIDSESRALFNGRINLVEQERVKREQEDGIFSKTLAIKRIKCYLRELADSIDEILEGFICFWDWMEENEFKNSETVYSKLEQYIEDNELVQIVVDGEEYKEYPKNIKKAKETLKKAEKIQLLWRKQEEERKREEAKKKELEHQKAIEEIAKKIQSAKNVKHMIYAGKECYFVITPNGNVIAGGDNMEFNQAVSLWENIVQIAGGDKHIVGLKEDGTVVAAGDNYHGQCNVSTWNNIVSIAAGYNHTVGLRKDGTVVAVGNNSPDYNYRKESTKGACAVEYWKDIIAITAGSAFTAGLKRNGKVVVVGSCCKPSAEYNGGDYKERDICNWPPVIDIVANNDDLYGLTNEGKLITTNIGIGGDKWSDLISISAPFNSYTALVAVKKNGTAIALWRINGWDEFEFNKHHDIICAVGQASLSKKHLLCLKMDGTLVEYPVDGFKSNLKELKLFNHPDTAHQEKLDLIEKEIEAKKEELEQTKGLFSGHKKRMLRTTIDKLENRMDLLKK